MFTLNSLSYFRFISFMLIITTYLNVLTNNLPPIIGSHHLWTPIWLLSILLLAPKVFTNKLFLLVIIYNLTLFLGLKIIWFNTSDFVKTGVIQNLYVFTIAFSIYSYYKSSGDFKGLALITKWAIIFIGITAIMSIYSSILDPMYARKFTSGENIGELVRFGGGSHELSGIICCLFPILIYYYRYNSESLFSRKLILLFGVICFIAVLRIQIFANILLMIFVIFFSISGSKKFKQSLFISIMLVILFVAIPNKIYAEFMMKIAGFFDSDSNVFLKFNDFSDYLLFDETDSATGRRIDRYPLLWDAFKQNPIFGYFASENRFDISAGAHLYWMNVLTTFGVILFIPFVYIYYSFIKSTMKNYNKGYYYYYLISAASFIVLGFMKTIGGREMYYWYFGLLNGLYYLPLLKSKSSRVVISN